MRTMERVTGSGPQRSEAEPEGLPVDFPHRPSEDAKQGKGAENEAGPLAAVGGEPRDPGSADGGLGAARKPALEVPEPVTLDLPALMRTGALAAMGARSTIAEEFRHIKLALLENLRHATSDRGNRMSLIMVTSALDGEGKTFCAVNLAVSMTMEVGRPVILVDADVVRDNVLRTLGLQQPRKGLLDVLSDPAVKLPNVLLKTNIPNLSILPAGTRNVRSTELLRSDAMEDLLEELCTRYPDSIVIFDSPPLLMTAEAKVLATRLGQVLVVVEAFRTPRRAVEEVFATLEECPVVMSIMNRGHEPSPDYGSYYG